MPNQLVNFIRTPLNAGAGALALLVVAAFFSLPQLHGLFATVPDESALQKAEGTITSFHQFSNAEGLRFSLSDSDRFFVLSAYSGAELAVRRAPPGASFSVLYDPTRLNGPLWSSRRSHIAYVVAVNGTPVRSYERVATAARDEAAWTPWVGAFLGVCGVSLLLWAAKMQFLALRSVSVPQKEG